MQTNVLCLLKFRTDTNQIPVLKTPTRYLSDLTQSCAIQAVVVFDLLARPRKPCSPYSSPFITAFGINWVAKTFFWKWCDCSMMSCQEMVLQISGHGQYMLWFHLFSGVFDESCEAGGNDTSNDCDWLFSCFRVISSIPSGTTYCLAKDLKKHCVPPPPKQKGSIPPKDWWNVDILSSSSILP